MTRRSTCSFSSKGQLEIAARASGRLGGGHFLEALSLGDRVKTISYARACHRILEVNPHARQSVRIQKQRDFKERVSNPVG